MGVTLAGVPCESPRELHRDCVRLGLPTGWAELANSYTCELGARSGDGWLILSRPALLRIDPALAFAGRYDLTFYGTNETGPAGSVTIKSLAIASAECLTPAAETAAAAYFVRLADRRASLNRALVDLGYNVRSAATGEHYPATLDGGSAWTWADLLADLWAAAGLGTSPGWPTTPAGTPEGIELWQTPALDAVEHVLGLGGCALRYDPTADTFGVVRPGDADADYDRIAALYDRWRIWDTHPIRPAARNRPGAVRVLFPRVPHTSGDGSPWYALDTDDTGGGEAGTYAVVHDPMPALFAEEGDLTPTNAAELSARAADRAAAYFREVSGPAIKERFVYPLPLAGAFLPGARVRGIRWSERAAAPRPGLGTITETYPGVSLRVLPDPARCCVPPARAMPPARVTEGPHAEEIGDGATSSFVVNHGLGSQAVSVLIREAAAPYRQITADVYYTSTTTVTVEFDPLDPPAAGQYEVVVSLPGGASTPTGLVGPPSSTDGGLTTWSGTAGKNLGSSAVTLVGSTFTGGSAGGDELTFRGSSHPTLPGLVTFTASDASALTVIDVARVLRTTSATPAAGLGSAFTYTLPDAGLTDRTAARLKTIWTDATAGAASAQFVIEAMYAGVARDLFRLYPAGGFSVPTVAGTPAPPSPGEVSVYLDADGKLYTQTSAGVVTDHSETLPATPPAAVELSAVPTWFLADTITHDDLTDNDTSQDITAYTLPAKAAIHGILVRTKTAGAGPGLISLGIGLVINGAGTGGAGNGMSADDVAAQFIWNNPGTGGIESWTATATIVVRFTSAGANLLALTAGEWEVYLLLSTLG
jgi:hypothetical protein